MSAPRSPQFRQCIGNGQQPNFYARPSTPSTASSALLSRDGHNSNTFSISSRKRGRDSGIETSFSTARDTGSREHADTISSSTCSLRASPAPLANMKYRLAGGLDTPTAAALAYSDDSRQDSERSFRRTWSSSGTKRDGQGPILRMQGLEREGNGRKRPRQGIEFSTESWPGYMFRLAGGIAGKVWEFCREGTFKGFAAGGGSAYDMGGSTPRRVGTHQTSTPEPPPVAIVPPERASTPVPGSFPAEGFETIDYNTEEEEYSRPAKRLQTSQAGDWVVVDTNNCATPDRLLDTGSSPRRLSGQRSFLPRPVSSNSPGGRTRASSSRMSSTAQVTPVHNGRTRIRTASFAPTRSPVTSSTKIATQSQSSPSAQLQRFATRRKREERENNIRMRDFNQQLESLIKSGQQALASKIEVEDDFSTPTERNTPRDQRSIVKPHKKRQIDKE